MDASRRRLLAAAGATVTGLAGCLGASGDGSPGDAGGDGGDAADSDRLSLPTLDVGGSPGGEVVVNPAGTVTLLDFFATWCAPCKPQMENLRGIRERFPELHMLSITNEDDEAAVREFWRDYEGTWPVAMDPDLQTNPKYDASQVPTLIVLDAVDEEVWRHVGLAGEDDVAEQLRAAGE
ncbi:TlpA family protein disulfide reductase [Halobacteriales archaeon QS_8_69_26]|nr:MAG: TlpA family protein disulfide reductase [Halobacteriales archaeon QS_8_69_26]